MKLYEIPNKSKIYCELSDGSKYLIFDHPDGMYSYCITEKGGIAHLSVAQELKKYKDGYALAPEKKEKTIGEVLEKARKARWKKTPKEERKKISNKLHTAKRLKKLSTETKKK